MKMTPTEIEKQQFKIKFRGFDIREVDEFIENVAEEQPDLQVDASAPGGLSFAGSVAPTYAVDNNFNGPGCDTCTAGEVSITLQ